MPLDQNPTMGSTEEIYEISTKTQEVVDEYENYIGGGFAPYPVRFLSPF
jgi:ornithine--oxo-acid transaminase